MRIKIVLLYFMLCNLVAYSNDWDLFQLGQKSYFKPNLTYNSVYCSFIDSSYTIGSSRYNCFLRKEHSSGIPSCYDSLIRIPIGGYIAQNFPLSNYDTLVYRNDSVFIALPNSNYNNVLFFIPTASINQTWNIQSTNPNVLYHLQARCSSLGIRSFLGISDSVRIFSFHLFNTTSQMASPWDTMQIILSKHFGLIQAVSESDLFYPYSFGFYASYITLAGISTNTQSLGFLPPSANDYFHFSVGDVFMWRRQDFNFWHTCTYRTYSRDSITQVINNADSIFIRYDETTKQNDSSITFTANVTKTYYWNTLQSLANAPPNWFTTTASDSSTFSWGFAGWGKEIAYTESYSLDTIQNIPVVTYGGNYSGEYILPNNCMLYSIPDATYSYSFNTLFGLTSSCYTSFGSFCNQLIGYTGNGITWGNPSIPLTISEFTNVKIGNISFSPNPASNQITLTISKLESQTAITIYDIRGQVEKHFLLNATTSILDVSELSNGIHTCVISNNNEVRTSKLVISHQNEY